MKLSEIEAVVERISSDGDVSVVSISGPGRPQTFTVAYRDFYGQPATRCLSQAEAEALADGILFLV